MRQVLGRLSADIARVLTGNTGRLRPQSINRHRTNPRVLLRRLCTGKHKPLYDPSLMTGDAVVVINCKDVAVRVPRYSHAARIDGMAGCTGNSILLGGWTAGDRPEKRTKAVPETFWLCWQSERNGVQRLDAEKANRGPPRLSRSLALSLSRSPLSLASCFAPPCAFWCPALLPHLLMSFVKKFSHTHECGWRCLRTGNAISGAWHAA
jgi:hypothetical protein